LFPPIFLSATVMAGSRINKTATMVSHESSGISGLGVVVGVGGVVVGVESVVDGVVVGVGFGVVGFAVGVAVGVGLVIVGVRVGVDCGVAIGVAVGVGVGVTGDGLYALSTWIRWVLVVAASTLGTTVTISRTVIMSKSFFCTSIHTLKS